MEKKSLLIVDDEKNICKVLKDYADHMGCFNPIVFAQDGAIAGSKLKNQKFDLILLDMNLPKRSGSELIKEIFEDKRSLNKIENILIVSGTLDKALITNLLSMGCKNFLTKPFTEADFQEKILKMIKN